MTDQTNVGTEAAAPVTATPENPTITTSTPADTQSAGVSVDASIQTAQTVTPSSDAPVSPAPVAEGNAPAAVSVVEPSIPTPTPVSTDPVAEGNVSAGVLAPATEVSTQSPSVVPVGTNGANENPTPQPTGATASAAVPTPPAATNTGATTAPVAKVDEHEGVLAEIRDAIEHFEAAFKHLIGLADKPEVTKARGYGNELGALKSAHAYQLSSLKDKVSKQ